MSSSTTRRLAAVILVDADDVLATSAAKLGLDCRHCRSGEEALLAASSLGFKPLALVIDLELPGMDGLDTLRSLRLLEPLASTPALLLADAPSEEAQVAAYDLGVEEILPRDVSAVVLQVRLRQLRARRRRQRDVDPHPGAVLDGHVIVKRLGRGGMGSVYLVEAPDGGPRMALKLFHPEDEEHDDQLGRFLREAQTLACLEHPYLVKVHSAGVIEDRGYYVMDYLDGGGLTDRLEGQRRLPVADALDIIAKVADAIHYAHSHQLLHRDLKPDNVLFGPDGEPRVTDFGLVIDPTDSRSRMTESGLILGTPHYMSPEQILSPESIDHRSDVFSLGMLLYEMLVGDVPFGHLGGIDAMLKIAREDITPPIYLRSEIGEEANRVACDALARDRQLRTQTAAELAKGARAALAAVE